MSELLISEAVEFLGLKDWDNESALEWLCWPPDVFAVVAFILRESGAYARMVGEPHQPPFLNCFQREQEAEAVADEWIESAVAISKFIPGPGKKVEAPKYVQEAWKVIRSQAKVTPLSKIASLPTPGRRTLPLWAHLLKLLASADIACAGFGLFESLDLTKYAQDSQKLRKMELFNELQMIIIAKLQGQAFGAEPSTLCRLIDASRAAVLPKMHTAQVGLTVRCFSHNLALSSRADVHARWRFAGKGGSANQRHGRNLLLVPWPHVIRPSQFCESICREGMHDQLPHSHGYFQLKEKESADELSAGYVQNLLDIARRDVGPVDGIVFPEASVSEHEFDRLKFFMNDERLEFLAAGVYKPPSVQHPGENYAKILYRLDSGYAEVEQHKHHRWSLDREQIVNYGLGGSLDPARRWWECIKIHKRDVHFIALDSLLVFTVLICEDLARPEPVGDLVRSVGPNLVIALLQDGPQLESRWSSRYAMSLTDDPGCSVLTLTSLGMSRMSKPKNAAIDQSRVIALWRDRTTGTRQLKLPDGDDALVLCLTETREEEWTADGRGDGKHTGGLHLVGVNGIRAQDRPSSAN